MHASKTKPLDLSVFPSSLLVIFLLLKPFRSHGDLLK